MSWWARDSSPCMFAVWASSAARRTCLGVSAALSTSDAALLASAAVEALKGLDLGLELPLSRTWDPGVLGARWGASAPAASAGELWPKRQL